MDPTDGFDFSFTFFNHTSSQETFIRNVTKRWENIIVGDLENVSGDGLSSLHSFAADHCFYDDDIDDLHGRLSQYFLFIG